MIKIVKNNMQKNPEKKPSKGIYLLPNLFTTASLFFGCYAIIQSINHEFESSAIALFIAMFMDGLDGRVARITNTMSDFGKEYDSLSDVISFGLAPALSIYFFSLIENGKLGMVVAFLYVASTALRLARFNSAPDLEQDKKYFQGLPCPSAAAIVASFIWFTSEYSIPGFFEKYGSLALVIMASLAMVSNVSYYSFKDINVKGKMSFVGLFMIVILFVLIALDPPLVLFIMFFLYLLSGPLLTVPYINKKAARIPSVSEAFELEDEENSN